MDGEFWTTVAVAASISTALATGTATLTSLWWRRLDREEADWLALKGESQWIANSAVAAPHATASIANVGDGAAFRLEVSGNGCTPRLRSEPVKSRVGTHQTDIDVVPVMQPGDAVDLRVWCEPAWWDAAAVIIEWTRSPTWRRHRSRRAMEIPLREIAARPTHGEIKVNEETGLTEPVARSEPAAPVLPDSLKVPPPKTKAGFGAWLARGAQPKRSQRI